MAVSLDIVNDQVNLCKRKRYIAVCTSVVKCDPSGCGIVDRSAGEAYIGHKASLLIPLFGSEQIVLASVENLGGLVDIKNRSSDGIYISVAGSCYAMIKDQSAFGSLDGRCSSSDLKALPPLGTSAHYMSVLSPENHVGAL